LHNTPVTFLVHVHAMALLYLVGLQVAVKLPARMLVERCRKSVRTRANSWRVGGKGGREECTGLHWSLLQPLWMGVCTARWGRGRAHQRAYGLLCRHQRGCGEGALGTRTLPPIMGERARGAERVGRRNASKSARVSLLAMQCTVKDGINI
jgi:hypothetical protein